MRQAVSLSHEEHRLDNGLRVILHPDRRLPRVAVNLLFRVGAADDPPGRSGLAHLLEHLMFMGTKRVPEGRFDSLMESVGGWSNAFTSEDYTVYYDVGPARLLETLLWLEADRLAGAGPALTRAKLRVQRDVVLNELLQEYHNTPYGVAELVQPGMLYRRGHPYARTVIGSADELRRVTVSDVRGHLERFYSPANMSLVLAGDFDPGAAMARVRRYFGWIRSRGEARGARPARGGRRGGHRILRDAVELPRLQISWHSPAYFRAGDAEMDLVAEILSSGKHSWLHRELVHRRRLAASVDAYQLSRPLGSVFTVGITLRSGVPTKRLEDATRERLATFLSRRLEAELRRARRGFETGYFLGLQRLQRRAELLNLHAEALGRPDGVAADLARYRRVSTRSIRAVYSAVLRRPPAVIWVLPR